MAGISFAIMAAPRSLAVNGHFLPAGFSQPSSSASPADQARSGDQNRVKGYSLTPEKYKQAVDYSRAGYRLYFVDSAWGLVVLLALLRWRVAARIRDLALACARQSRFLQAVIFAPVLILIVVLLRLPIEIYAHHLSLTYQQSVEGWGSWFWDWTKGILLIVLGSTILVWLLYAILRRSPGRWWFYFWLATIPIIIGFLFIEPVLIEPMFYRFEPLAARPLALVAEIEKVVKRGGVDIPSTRMFEMTASEKTNSVNAYVTGFGASKRVVVWDTTIRSLTTPEILAVFGHEMGHYVLGHLQKGIAWLIASLFFSLLLGFHVVRWADRRWGPRCGIQSLDDWASLPLLLLVLGIIAFVTTPIDNAFSRYQEHQADVYGLEVIHGIVPDSQQVAAHDFQIEGEIDLQDPDPSPFVKFWLFTHPPLAERLEFALHYDPWSKGEKPQFVR
jgi:Zn-dependent protease with chaperone function